MRVARENPTWGYTRLRGALKNLGHEIGRNTIKRLLVEHGIAPAPERGRSMSWSTFIKAHWGAIGCFRCLLLVMCTHPFAKGALTLHLARGEGHKRYFDCNLMHRKVLASSHQHLMAEAPRSPSLYSAQLRTWYFFCFACLYWQRLGYFMLEHTSATTIGGFRSQPERCNNAGFR